jgi:hypothetical protein
VLHLFKIPAAEFRQAVLRESATWTTDTWLVVELGHLLVLAVWKMHRDKAPPPEHFRQGVDWHALYLQVIHFSY